ncbi:MAG: hypothetical protein OXU23_04080 [Candidatus Poribacteria bacterium]|nr:hypothetical protein [Candidatus Poribacteria bacterium]
MELRIIPINVVEEKVHAQLFPPDGDYVTWIRANNPTDIYQMYQEVSNHQ